MLKSWLKSPSGEKTITSALSTLLKLLLATIRWKTIDHGGKALVEKGQPVIFVNWHSRLLSIPAMLGGKYPTAYIISPSRDGRAISGMVAPLGVETIWGSKSQKAISGYRDMRRRLQAGFHVGITPDGPRGPARKAAPGAVTLAKASGVPLVPIAWSTSRMKRFDSWDRLALPKPFSRGVFVFGSPIYLNKDTTEDTILAECINLEDAINDVTAEADLYFGHSADHVIERYGVEKKKHYEKDTE